MVKTREVGRKKLNQATRYLTIVLGVAQSMGITAGFNSLSQTGIVNNPTLGTFVMIAVILTAGTMFVTWMGEQITEKGIGNGVSMIIFAGIISRLPGAVKEIYEDYFVNIESSYLAICYFHCNLSYCYFGDCYSRNVLPTSRT